METLSRERASRAQQELEALLDSEIAYRFMSGCADFMSREGLEHLKKAAVRGERWAFRLLVDAMKVLAKLEIARASSQGRREAPPVRVRTRFATDGEKT